MNQEPQGRIRNPLLWVLLNSLWLLPLAYGIKCMVTTSGRCIGPRLDGRPTPPGLLGDLHSVEGEAAMWAGSGYIAIAVFVYLYVYAKPGPDAWWGRHLVRIPLCCGSLVALAWFWHKAVRV